MEEVWKSVHDWPGYEVSNLGRVRSFKKKVKGQIAWAITEKPQRILKPSLGSGYRQVNLSHNGETQCHRIATLVLEAFVGPKSSNMEGCHKDCNKTNNRLDNLRYDTHRANIRDGVGEHIANRLTNRQAVELRHLAAQGISDQELAGRFDVSINTVSKCRRGYTFAYLRGPLTQRLTGPKTVTKLKDRQVQQMRQEGQRQDISIVELAEQYNIDVSYVSLILRGLRRKNAGGPISKPRYKWAKSMA